VSQLQSAALALSIAATLVGVWVFALGVRAVARVVGIGGPAPERVNHPVRRTWVAFWEIVHHRRFRGRPAVLVAHWYVMIAFPVLFVSLVTGYGQLVEPRFALPLIGQWPPLEWLIELVAWAALLGIGALVAVRQIEHPRRGRAAARSRSASGAGSASGAPGARASRFFGSNAGQAYFVEAIIGGVVLAVLLIRGLEYALAAQSPTTAHLATAAHFPLTGWFGSAWISASTATLENAVVVLALVKILLSMVWMVVVGSRPAMGVSWHRFLAVLNVWARREPGRPALGPLPPVRAAGAPVDFAALDALPPDARLGVGRIEDFTWKGLLDFSSCTECGRCQEQCPAWSTGKVLSPKLVMLALRDHAHATAPHLRAAPNASTEPAGHTAGTGHVPLPFPTNRGANGGPDAGTHAGVDVLSLVGDVVDPQALWDCTTCGACVHECPVDIEHIDHIVDMRRHEVLMASSFPEELAPMFTGLERQSNPWGLPARGRLDWAKDLPFDVPVIGDDLPDASGVEYLFWVGCAGAYDDRAKRTTRAVAELLHTAGVRFAVLGQRESCTGDPARRAGNEFLYQVLAQAAIEALSGARPKQIVATCPHCFNTLAREYPQLGGQFDVIHHTQLLDRLVSEGRLTPAPQADRSVTYHDPCYLGRHNEIYAPPRDLIGALPGVRLDEMPRTRERAFCCGGGGARMWLEERTGTRISTDRAAEALGTGAATVATGCPFCTVMLSDGVAAHTPSGSPRKAEVVDVALLLLDAVRDRPAGPTGD
jgi:Fe-S oxidoreductase